VRRLWVATCDGDGDRLSMGWSHIGVEKSTTGYDSMSLHYAIIHRCSWINVLELWSGNCINAHALSTFQSSKIKHTYPNLKATLLYYAITRGPYIVVGIPAKEFCRTQTLVCIIWIGTQEYLNQENNGIKALWREAYISRIKIKYNFGLICYICSHNKAIYLFEHNLGRCASFDVYS
jgi:hypothetical protein